MKIYNIRDMLAQGEEETLKSVIATFSSAKIKDDGNTEVLNRDICTCQQILDTKNKKLYSEKDGKRYLQYLTIV